jgi:hypothetical protein
LLKNSWRAPQSPSAAKAVIENMPVIAAVNRCATQKQEQNRVFQQSVKARILSALSGTAEAERYPKPLMRPVVALTLALRRLLTQSTEERRMGRWVAILLDCIAKKWNIATGQNGRSTELGNAYNKE